MISFFIKIYCLLTIIAITISFVEPSYTINKRARPPSILLQLSKPLSTNISITVRDKEGTATGELAV